MAILVCAVAIWKLHSNVEPTDAEFASLPIVQKLTGRFLWADATLDLHKDFNSTVWWDDTDGYSYRMQTDGGAIIAAAVDVKMAPNDRVAETYFAKELDITREVFLRRGFTLDELNSSTSTADQHFYDYVQAYKNGDELCTVAVNPDYSTYAGGGTKTGYTLTANCANTLAQAQVEQKPFLNALDLRGKEATAYIENQSGDYYLVSMEYRRLGEAAIVKKEGQNYRVLLVSQEAPPCDLIEKEKIPTELLGPLGGGGCYESDGSYREPTSTYPILLPADQVLIEATNASSSAPAGFHTLRDTQLKLTFNIPLDWKAQVLPEGDGRPSLISPDFANPLGSMTGAYLHYSFASLPDQFKGKPNDYMALLKQGSTWTQMSLDGHAAYISQSNNGYAMVVSQFGDNWFVMINFADPGKKYTPVFDEFLRSFHAQ